MVNRIVFLVVGILVSPWIIASSAAEDTVTATVERNPIAIDESVTYHLIIHDPSGEQPDFRALEKDFEILGQRSSSNIQIINGKKSHTQQYQLSLMPKRIGNLHIPPVTVGTQQSNPIELVVTTAKPQLSTPGNQDFFLEVEVTPDAPYVRSQLLLTVRLFIGVSLVSGSLSEPEPADTIVHKLGDDREFTTTRNGRSWRVNERRYALFPQHAGELVIPPLLFQGQAGRRSNSFFDPFPQQGPIKRVRSRELRIEVLPQPEQSPQPWLPTERLIGSMQIAENNKKVRAGEPITVSLTLEATGLPANTLPEPELPVAASVRTYPDQPLFDERITAKGMVGVLQKKITLIPAAPGQLALAPRPLAWWNTTTGQVEYVRFVPQTLDVLPPVPTAPSTPPPSQRVPPVEQPPSSASSEIAAGANEQAGSRWAWATAGGWFYTSLALGGCWLITLLAWWSRERSRAAGTAVQPTGDHTRNDSRLEKALRQACAAGHPESARKALQQLAPLSSMPGQFQVASHSDPLVSAVNELNAFLYRRQQPEQSWDGEKLWKAWKAHRRQPSGKTEVHKGNGLAPLSTAGGID